MREKESTKFDWNMEYEEEEEEENKEKKEREKEERIECLQRRHNYTDNLFIVSAT